MQVRNSPYGVRLFEFKNWVEKEKVLLILFSFKDFKTEYHKTIVLQVNRDNNDNKCMLYYMKLKMAVLNVNFRVNFSEIVVFF